MWKLPVTGNSRYILNMAEKVRIIGNPNSKRMIKVINIYLNDAMQTYIKDNGNGCVLYFACYVIYIMRAG